MDLFENKNRTQHIDADSESLLLYIGKYAFLNIFENIDIWGDFWSQVENLQTILNLKFQPFY